MSKLALRVPHSYRQGQVTNPKPSSTPISHLPQDNSDSRDSLPFKMANLPTEEQKAKVKIFMKSRRDWTQWKSERLLGCGLHSVVGLFSRNRMFKSADFDREYQYAAVKETDHYQHYVERGELPEEVVTLTKLKPLKCKNIIKMIKWGPLPKLKGVNLQKYRIYTEFCQHGDLGRLLYRHRRYGFESQYLTMLSHS